MKQIQIIQTLRSRLATFAVLGLALSAMPAHAVDPLLDDFSREEQSSILVPRMVVDDASIGGQSVATLTTDDGVLKVKGELVPARGQPAFVSLVLLLSPMGSPQDLSEYEGIRLRYRILEGSVSLQVASTEIVNYDYHTKALVRRPGKLQEILIPFKDLKRLWSGQTPLNLETITSINLVASGVQKADFEYAVDEIGFY